MAKIQYADKTALYNNPDIADVNKVKDTDMNEIKRVVNQNADLIPTNNNQLSNGAGYITKTVNNLDNYYTKSEVNNKDTGLQNQISGIVESGSNENGNWIKWSDGTMICTYASNNFKLNIDKPEGNMFWDKITLAHPELRNFPKEFKRLDSISIICKTYDLIYVTIGEPHTPLVLITDDMYFISPIIHSDCNVNFSYIAIGRWK